MPTTGLGRAVSAFALVLWLLGVPSLAAAQKLPDFSHLVEAQGPVVVHISTTFSVRSPAPHPPERGDPQPDFSRRSQSPEAGAREFRAQSQGQIQSQGRGESQGSGFLISADGYILTNAHVVARADTITVRLADRREFQARVVGADPRTDLALLRIDATGLPRATFGDPGRLRAGDWVVAIGTPFGFENSVTAGIISAKDRSLPTDPLVPFLQTDVAIHPGNSGGPLFNLRGEVVAINSQIYSRNGDFMGVSFAIPIDVALGVSDQLRRTGRVRRGWLGAVVRDVDGGLARDLARSLGQSRAAGALVTHVDPGGPAARAGLQAGDVVFRYRGATVAGSADLPRRVSATQPGACVDLRVWRRGAIRVLPVTVGEWAAERAATRPPTTDGPTAVAGQVAAAGMAPSPGHLGLTIAEPGPRERGLRVVAAQGEAARAGLEPGDHILAVNGTRVNDLRQFDRLLRATAPGTAGHPPALLVRRGGSAVYLPLRPDDR